MEERDRRVSKGPKKGKGAAASRKRKAFHDNDDEDDEYEVCFILILSHFFEKVKKKSNSEIC
jgi:hypothetical protein